MRNALLLLWLALSAPTVHAQGSPVSEYDAIRRAGMDYVEGFYEGDTTKLARALRSDLAKYGFWRDSAGTYAGESMSFAEAIAYAVKVRQRNAPVPAECPKRVDVLDAGERIAVAKVTAWWGFDYILLGKFDGRWMIKDVMWEGPPKPSSR